MIQSIEGQPPGWGTEKVGGWIWGEEKWKTSTTLAIFYTRIASMLLNLFVYFNNRTNNNEDESYHLLRVYYAPGTKHYLI